MSDDPIKKKKEMFGDESESQVLVWARRIGVGALVILVLALFIWFVLILPRSNEIGQLQSELAAAQDQIATLESQLVDLESVKPEREVLSLLAQANTARFEIYRIRWDSAEAALLPAGQTLDTLASELGDEYSGTIADLEARLALSLEDIQDESRIPALGDLEVFVNILEHLLDSLQTP